MKHFYFFFILLFSAFSVCGQVTKKVYFLGNSYTSYNNLPDLIQQVAKSTNDILTYQATLPGGESLQNHMNNQAVLDNIANNTWDYVVLQEQSQRPAFDDYYTFPYAAVLGDKIKKSSACAKILFYMTWGYKYGDPVNCKNGIKHMCTYEDMDDKIADSYMRMGKANKGVVSPVGKVWRAIRTRYPQMELYNTQDNSHPSYLGSMAAAYTFYAVIFKKDPTLVPFDGTLSASDAAKIKSIVKEVVFDQMNLYNFVVDNTTASFTINTTTAPLVTFANTSSVADAVHWDFGDGTTSTDLNPTHSYTQKGEFIVTLTITTCGETREVKQTVQIETLSLESFEGIVYSIYPNPATSYLFVYTEQELISSVYDLSGKRLNVKMEYNENHYQVDVRHLAQGAYFLQLQANGKTKQIKFLKK